MRAERIFHVHRKSLQIQYSNTPKLQYSIGDAKRNQILTMELIKKLRIDNDLGLHARAAAKIVELARQYESELFLRRDDEEVDGASILSILTLACPKGTEVEVRAVGDDSEELLEKLSELFKGKFGEKK
jgi:phosphocarrier protein HPr